MVGVVLLPETFKRLDHSKHALVAMHQVHPCNWRLLSSTVFSTLVVCYPLCCKQLKLNYANCWNLVFSSGYAGCFLPCLLVLLFLRVGSLRLFWGMVVRGCARRDLC